MNKKEQEDFKNLQNLQEKVDKLNDKINTKWEKYDKRSKLTLLKQELGIPIYLGFLWWKKCPKCNSKLKEKTIKRSNYNIHHATLYYCKKCKYTALTTQFCYPNIYN